MSPSWWKKLFSGKSENEEGKADDDDKPSSIVVTSGNVECVWTYRCADCFKNLGASKRRACKHQAKGHTVLWAVNKRKKGEVEFYFQQRLQYSCSSCDLPLEWCTWRLHRDAGHFVVAQMTPPAKSSH